MNKTGYEKLISVLKPVYLEEKFADAYEKWTGEGHVLSDAELLKILDRYELSPEWINRLTGYLDALRSDPAVTEYMTFVSWIMCDARYTYYIEDKTDFNLTLIGDPGRTVTFFICLSCVFYAEKDLIRRQIPASLYEDIPHRMLKRQMNKIMQSDDFFVDDLQWQANFYSLSIYLFDRFLFVPCRFDDPYTFYRRGDEVVGIADDGLSVDTEGQIILKKEIPSGSEGRTVSNGEISSVTEEAGDIKKADPAEADVKNGHYYGGFREDRKVSFVTERRENGSEVTGYRISPCGYITDSLITLDKSEYKQILKRDDWMIGFHIPEGEGYVPARVRSSMKPAWEFFKKYYPEIPFKGFWSASWLYDGRLSLLLPDDSNIVRVQRHLFNYSGGWNGEMLYLELYGDVDMPLEDVPKESSLQKKVARFLENGGRFCEPGMVYFPEELDKDHEKMIYITPEDLERQDELFESNGLKGRI
ncbi:MAG: hypothetical protein K5886_04650 [Lachnospiraceae bacterium]|nr:hypothetical protein [Lachnospiraceae bacterium]